MSTAVGARTSNTKKVPAPASSTEEAPPGYPRWAGWAVAVGIPTAAVAAHASFYSQWIEDDAGITFAYARSITSGAGPVLQPGAAPVEGFSDPAWLMVLMVGRWLGLFDRGTWFGVPDLVAFPKLIALICCAGIFAAFYVTARAVSTRPVLITVVAGVSTAAVPSFVIWSFSGLENALFALVVVTLGAILVRATISGRLLEQRTAVTCGALAALAGLTRPDGMIYLLAYPAAVVVVARALPTATTNRAVPGARPRSDPEAKAGAAKPDGVMGASETTWRDIARAAAISLAAFAAPVVLYLAWRIAEFGDWLPNTARAKEQGLPGPEELNQPANLLSYAGWLTAILAVVVLTAVVLGRRSTTRTAVAVLLVPLTLAVLAFAVLKPDWMSQLRFTTPVWPLAALATTLAVASKITRASTRTRLLAAALVAVAGSLSIVNWSQDAVTFKHHPTAPLCHVAQDVGITPNSYADLLGIRNGTLMAVDAGGTALTSRLRFVDLAGLADRNIARYWQVHDIPGLRNYMFDQVRPTFFKVWNGWGGADRESMVNDPRLARDYFLVFSDGIGGGTWVRRDAVRDPAALYRTQAWARDHFLSIQNHPSATGWTCGPTLRPSTYIS